jgi:anaerobic selenocysteine-containing dehydrogenase
MGEFPIASLAEEIETPGEGQIKALITIAGNPALSAPNGSRLAEALASLEFMVSIDPYRNETTRHADVLLPPPTPLERSHFDLAFYGLAVRNVVNYSAPIFATDAPQESELLARLAFAVQGKGSGVDLDAVDDMMVNVVAEAAVHNEASAVHGESAADLVAKSKGKPGPERIIDVLLRGGPFGDRLSLEEVERHPHGIDLGALEPQLPGLLRTQSGCIELMPDAIVAELERLETESGEAASGLVLVGRRHLRSNNSWMHNVEKLVSGRDRCTLQIHPDDAKARGLEGEGVHARIRSRVGEVVAPVEQTDSIMRGVVSLPHGWGHVGAGLQLGVATRHAGVNSNVLTDDERLDRPSGTAVLNGIPVEIEVVAP